MAAARSWADREERQHAIWLHAMYWVDWDDANTPDVLPRTDDSALDRLLKAVHSRQIATPEGSAE